MADLTEYKKILQELARTGSQDYVNNSSVDHAAVMIEEMFRNAQGTVCLFSGHLEPLVYDRHELRQATAEFLNKSDSKLNIIVQLPDPDNMATLHQNSFVALLGKHQEKVKLFEATSNKLKDLDKHFMVIRTITGNYGLRFEIDTGEHIATGTFNDEENGELLYNFFNSCLTDSVHEIALPN